MNNNMYVSASPHLRSGISTTSVMRDVIIALLPSVIAGNIIFGIRALFIVVLTVASCVASEYIARRVMKRSNTIGDLSAVVTGILLGLNYPVGINPFMAVFGGVVAIVVAKQMFGGIGQNFVNPALAARIILLVSFPTDMTTWATPFYYTGTVDAVTGATPLAQNASGTFTGSYLDLFLGNVGGCIGETCVLAILLGGIYLIARKVISPVIPVTFIATVFVLAFIMGQDPVFHILSGGVMLGAFFMATDYTTSPITTKGKVIFAVGCGLMTMLIRVYANLPEGVSFSIVLMNILVPHIENLTRPTAFGQEKPVKAAKETVKEAAKADNSSEKKGDK